METCVRETTRFGRCFLLTARPLAARRCRWRALRTPPVPPPARARAPPEGAGMGIDSLLTAAVVGGNAQYQRQPGRLGLVRKPGCFHFWGVECILAVIGTGGPCLLSVCSVSA
eukprot:1196309-Prorocentrum_minimum.AAC.6